VKPLGVTRQIALHCPLAAAAWAATVFAQQPATPAGSPPLTAVQVPSTVNPVRVRRPLQVHWQRGLLSISADRAPLGVVLAIIARRTGLNLQGVEAVRDQLVSVDFAGVTLEHGLENLLLGANYVIQGSSGSAGEHRLRVVVFGPRNAPGQLGAAAPGVVPAGPVPIQPDPASRKSAGKPCGRPELQQLCNALDDADPAIRAAAIEEYSKLPPEAAQAIRAGLPEEKKAEIDTLQRLQHLTENRNADAQNVLATLADALKDKDSAVQAYAVQNLAERGSNEAIRYLRNAFPDLDAGNKMLVIESVAQNEGARQILRDAMQDPDESVRSVANDLLEQLTPANAGNDHSN
jgi:hypothetical protein